MRRLMLKSKIHRATVTETDLNYAGSLTLDPRLMELADLFQYEHVHVLDLTSGARFETYVIAGGRGDVVVNGAAARLVQPNDQVIILSFASYDEVELVAFEPQIVFVDAQNSPSDSQPVG